jgi:hypothetical protein
MIKRIDNAACCCTPRTESELTLAEPPGESKDSCVLADGWQRSDPPMGRP